MAFSERALEVAYVWYCGHGQDVHILIGIPRALWLDVLCRLHPAASCGTCLFCLLPSLFPYGRVRFNWQFPVFLPVMISVNYTKGKKSMVVRRTGYYFVWPILKNKKQHQKAERERVHLVCVCASTVCLCSVCVHLLYVCVLCACIYCMIVCMFVFCVRVHLLYACVYVCVRVHLLYACACVYVCVLCVCIYFVFVFCVCASIVCLCVCLCSLCVHLLYACVYVCVLCVCIYCMLVCMFVFCVCVHLLYACACVYVCVLDKYREPGGC